MWIMLKLEKPTLSSTKFIGYQSSQPGRHVPASLEVMTHYIKLQLKPILLSSSSPVKGISLKLCRSCTLAMTIRESDLLFSSSHHFAQFTNCLGSCDNKTF